MQALSDVIEQRRARRALSGKPVPDEVMRRVMRAATYAPSCFNNQPWRFVVLTGEEELAKAKDGLSTGNYWAGKAPVIVLAVTRQDLDCRLSQGRDYAYFDLGQAVQSLILQATAEGLIAHPIAGFKPAVIKEAFSIPEGYVLLTLIIIGYPGDAAHLNEKHRQLEISERSRKPDRQVVGWNRWIEGEPKTEGG